MVGATTFRHPDPIIEFTGEKARNAGKRHGTLQGQRPGSIPAHGNAMGHGITMNIEG
jgi:hypothetical protein